MANKRNKKTYSGRKFGLASGIHAVRRRRPRKRELWLEKRAAEGLYWYCCPRCEGRFNDTIELISHQQNCSSEEKGKPTEKTSGTPQDLSQNIKVETETVTRSNLTSASDLETEVTMVTNSIYGNKQNAPSVSHIDLMSDTRQNSNNSDSKVLNENNVNSFDNNNNATSLACQNQTCKSGNSFLSKIENFSMHGEKTIKEILEIYSANIRASKPTDMELHEETLKKDLDSCVKSKLIDMELHEENSKQELDNCGNSKLTDRGVCDESLKQDLNSCENSDMCKMKQLQQTVSSTYQQPLHTITTDRHQYTYYLVSRKKKPDKILESTENLINVNKTDKRNGSPVGCNKTEIVPNKSRKGKKTLVDNKSGKVRQYKRCSKRDINTTKETNKLTKKDVKLEDFPDYYCTENITDSAFSVKHRSEKDRHCLRFLCKLCGSYRSLVKEHLEQHIYLHISGKLNCKWCKFVSDSTHNLRCHVKSKHHQVKSWYLCEFCGIEMHSSYGYKVHVGKLHGKAVYSCHQCKETFPNSEEYKKHQLNKHSCSTFRCKNCEVIYLSESAYENHLKNCKYKYDVKLYKCNYCDSVRNSRQKLQYHIKNVHSKDSIHKCSLCSFSAISKTQLTNHMNAHLGIHRHRCDLCKFSCVKKDQLTSHKRTHTGVKPFKCDKCTYAAAWNVQLKSHLKAHNSESQCACKFCGIVLKDKRCLKLHCKKEHSEMAS